MFSILLPFMILETAPGNAGLIAGCKKGNMNNASSAKRVTTNKVNESSNWVFEVQANGN